MIPVVVTSSRLAQFIPHKPESEQQTRCVNKLNHDVLSHTQMPLRHASGHTQRENAGFFIAQGWMT